MNNIARLYDDLCAAQDAPADFDEAIADEQLAASQAAYVAYLTAIFQTLGMDESLLRYVLPTNVLAQEIK